MLLKTCLECKMCGRYQFDLSDSKTSLEIIERVNELKLDGFKLGEIFPNDNVLTCIPKDNIVDLCVSKWGLNKLINARVESLGVKPIFNNYKRCCVIANSFYEWCNKQKYNISFNDEFVYFASIMDANNQLLIITKPSLDNMKDIHERMPIVLNQEEMINYLTKDKVIYKKKELIINEIN